MSEPWMLGLRLHRWAFLVAIVALLGGASWVRGEERSAEDEAKIIEEETKAEASLPMDKAPPPGLTGRVQLNGDATDEADAVVGVFVVKERAYQLRLGRAGMLDKLKTCNGKVAKLMGKIRMQGKYFIVEAVDVPVPGPAQDDRARRMSM